MSVAGKDGSEVLRDLADSGFEVESPDLWLFRPPEGHTWAEVVPILVSHLKVEEYSDKTIAALATLLARREAAAFWSQIVAAYSEATAPWSKGALAGTIAKIARKQNVAELAELFKQNASERTSPMFVRPLMRLDRGTWEPFFRDQVNDPVYGAEARAVLKGKSRNED